MTLDDLKPSNTFELQLVEMLKQSANSPVQAVEPVSVPAQVPPEVLDAIGLIAEKLVTLEAEILAVKSRVDVHTENFSALQSMAGDDK